MRDQHKRTDSGILPSPSERDSDAPSITANERSVELPNDFNAVHERAVINFLTDRVAGTSAWAMVFTAFDLLERAIVVFGTERLSFRDCVIDVC